MSLRLLLGFLSVVALCAAVDHDVFKTCEQAAFCSRLRATEPDARYELDLNNFSVTSNAITVGVVETNTSEVFSVTVYAVANNTFRVTVNDGPRYKLTGVLVGEPPESDFSITFGNGNFRFSLDTENSAVINASPFSIEFYKNSNLVAVFNGNNRLVLERGGVANQSIAFDVEFPGAARAYGIPEHADRLALRTTTNGSDPYRLYNLDVAYYELDSPMALYGAVPVLYAHSANGTVGVFFHNAAEQWVDITNGDDGVDAYFIAEAGTLDFFVFTGPTPQDAVAQYTALTGAAPIPPYWALGYHQCRWNYESDEDAEFVIAQLDNYDFPVDAIWLDIEYTDEKKYFTWNPVNFSDPLELQSNLSSTNRSLVTIIDPHIKVESGYFVYDTALENDYFVRTESGDVFEGECWPGLSSYIDFFNPSALEYYSSLFSYDNFVNSTPVLAGIWNDMNEPSVFDDSLEKTFPKDLVHYGGISHRNVHNVYGLNQTIGTYNGLVARSNGTTRPFILSRSHFAGSQRYTAVWTGDNTADWGYLAISYATCLSENLAGISFCGADVGGFFDNPNEELLQRWYQAGVWLPFYRAHSNIETARREPYLFGAEVQNRIRAALRQRYSHLPVFYTLFFEHYTTGAPVIRPLFYHYPTETAAFDIDDQLLVGRNILVRAITEPNVRTVSSYFPGGTNEVWYDIDTPLLYTGSGFSNVAVTLDRIPVYYRGGSIIPRKDIPRRNTAEQFGDDYTVYIFLNSTNRAEGRVYTDDQSSFNYQQLQYNYLSITYDNGFISTNPVNPNVSFPGATFVVDSYIVWRTPSNFAFDGVAGPVEMIKFTETADGQKISRLDHDLTKKTTFKLH